MKKIPLSHYAEIIMGQSPKGDNCNKNGHGIPLLNGPTEFGFYYPTPTQYTTDPKKKSKVNDILFCVRGSTTGRMNYSDQEYAIGRGIAAIRGKNEYPTTFVKVLIEHNLENLLKIATGSTFPNVSRSMINNLKVEKVSLSEAKKIAHILSTLDNKIELNRQMNRTLEAMAQAIFKSWFVDFDPVRAKMEAKSEADLDIAARELGISRDILDLFPDKLVESEMGLVPEGWEVKKVKDIMIFHYGKALKKSDRKEGSVPVYGSGGITGFHNAALVEKASVIVGRKGTVGSIYWEDRPFYPIDTVFYIEALKTSLAYCYYLLQTLPLKHMNTDAAVPGLNRNNVYRLDIIKPSELVLQEFDKTVSILRKKIYLNKQEIETLQKTLDSLLSKLLSGELDVSNIEVRSEL